MSPTTSVLRHAAPALMLLATLLPAGPVGAGRAPSPMPAPAVTTGPTTAGVAEDRPRAQPWSRDRDVAAPPAAVAPVGGRLLRTFDPPATPYGRGHRGVDLASTPGEPVRAALSGTVRFAGRVAGVHWVTVDHGGGLATTYGGLTPTIRAGQRVTLGAPLGRADRRGRVDWGARRDGAYVDPLGLLGGWVVRLVPVR